MSDPAADLALAAEFPAATREAWKAAAEKALKGRDFEKVLVGRTYDAVRIDPLYPKAEGSAPVSGRGAVPWRIAARMDHPDPKPANELVRADLEGGADALVIAFAGSRSARGFGLPAKPAALETALDGVMLDLIALRLDPDSDEGAAAETVLDLARRRGHGLASLDLDLGLDPIGAATGSGQLDASWDAALAKRFAGLAEAGFAGRLARADGRPYHEAGASEAQELGAVLATGIAYLRALEAGGCDLDRARDALSFLLVADADEFLTVAKFRAFRRLWAAVESACGLAPKPARVAAETAWRMTTRRDPWVNLLRGTLATFSAGIGGADAIAVLPFTAALGLPDAFARRLARNTQLVLLEECNLWRVADPVAGSGAFEALTADLVREGWARFREIEAEGGIAASLASGALTRRLAETRGKREAAIAVRRDPITGSSEFPDLRETPVAVLMEAPPAAAVAGTAFAPSPRGAMPRPTRPCARAPTPGSPRPAGGPRSSSPISVPRPPSRRARPSPATPSRRSASRRSPMTASRAARLCWTPSAPPAPTQPASARPMRSMPGRPRPSPRLCGRPAPATSSSPAAPVSTKPPGAPPGSAPSSRPE